MKKTLSLALLLSVSFPVFAFAAETAEKSASENGSGAYRLNPEVAAEKLKSPAVQNQGKAETDAKKPQILKEELPDGSTLEKLVAPDGRVIAEKTVKDGEIIKKILNYYYPGGQLLRRVTALDDGTSFYAEDYYMNGKVAAEANYLNENNKIGKEKKYDSTGTLRQEIPWVLPKENAKKPQNEQQTVRKGTVLSYYPDGRIAAAFSVGQNGKNIFYNRQGHPVKEIENAELLNFAPEIRPEDCLNSVVKLSLEELVELYEDEGDISYNKCGLPYRENFVYEIADIRGNSTAKVSYDETGMIRRIAAYTGGQKNGVEQKFDASGNLTAEINYKNGVKSGMASGFFPTREIAFRKRYENGKVVGSLACFFPTGEKAAEFVYKNGVKNGTAKIYGPNARDITFIDGKIAGTDAKPAKRLVAPSKLSALANPDAKCLDLSGKLEALELDIAANANTVTKAFTLDIPYNCTDFSSFKPENSNYACYDANNQLRAVFPTAYNRGEYALETIYTADGKLLYHIPHAQKQRQGFALQFDSKGKVVSEIYFNRGELAESSRSYYDNGAVREMMSIAEGAPRKLLVRYAKDGKLEFSLSYANGEMVDAFLADTAKNKDIYLRFYQNKLDNIREVNAGNPYNYIDYNLALGEYAVYKEDKLIKGGKICGYENLSPDIEIMPMPQPNAAEPQPQLESKPAPQVQSEPQPQLESKPAPQVQSEPQPVIKSEPAAPAATVLERAEKKAVAPVSAPIANETRAVPETVPPIVPAKEKNETGLAPVLPAEAAPMVEGLEPVSLEDFTGQNAIIPTAEEKKQAELAAKNIGPVAKPDIGQLADAVAKERLETAVTKAPEPLSKTEKFYYPNGSLRKTVATRGSRTEEVKEYSKTGLLITDTMYGDDGILTEKYFGSGEIRRKTKKAYTDNPVMAFVSREDFYDNGKLRYEILRQPETLLFADKEFYPDGTLKRETLQKGPLTFTIIEYAKDGTMEKITEQQGQTVAVKGYGKKQEVKSFTLNGADMPLNMAENSAAIMSDNAKTYTKKGVLKSEFKLKKNQNILNEYYPGGALKSEISFFDNGEISVKVFAKDGTLEKFAYLAPDGKLHIQKPELRVVPSYRERYWVDYNNPRWIENQDRYTVKNIARLNLDTAAYMLAELEAEVPELLQRLYGVY